MKMNSVNSPAFGCGACAAAYKNSRRLAEKRLQPGYAHDMIAKLRQAKETSNVDKEYKKWVKADLLSYEFHNRLNTFCEAASLYNAKLRSVYNRYLKP